MKILNAQLSRDLKEGKPVFLNLGCGPKPQPGTYGVDLLALEGVDVQADLNEPLDLLPENSVASVTSRHTFEHVSNLIGLLKELHRIVRPDGRIEIIVPHFSDPHGYSDPTHVRFFGLFTMCYFSDNHRWRRKVPTFYTDIRFTIEDAHIRFSRNGLDRLFGAMKEFLTNLHPNSQSLYERHFCWIFPCEEIRYVLRPRKIK